MKGYLSICRLFVAALALFGMGISLIKSIYLVESFGSLFHIFAQFTYVSNFIVAMVLILVSLGKLEDKYILIPLPSIVITYIVFSLFISKGLDSEPLYNIIEHYLTAFYLMFDYIFFVSGRTTFLRSFIFAISIVLIYLIYVFIYGFIVGYYPYHFFDLNKETIENVVLLVLFINIAVIILFTAFFVFKVLQLALYEKIGINPFSNKKEAINLQKN
ncbi:hypothetical protein ACFPDQ_04820 [Pseudofrancisella aestuarii]|uniref:Pr6Pr family membrane protein n=1 Tax=Pseudofrancisella aestuarii TaxID=2670347 RepID=A0ABV9TBQ4_9GAMM|nr:hypothetical protein [Pseudofrancisella aestuarii]